MGKGREIKTYVLGQELALEVPSGEERVVGGKPPPCRQPVVPRRRPCADGPQPPRPRPRAAGLPRSLERAPPPTLATALLSSRDETRGKEEARVF